MSSRIHLLGIRHHGPGSARNVRAQLQALQPDCILIEMPEQCTAMLADVANQELKPPVAVLLYNPKNLSEASFYPCTEYSPEWQAMRYAAQQKVQIRAIDLPFLFAPTANIPSLLSLLPLIDADQQEDQDLLRDPFMAIAQMDGYSDCERWWEARIERQDADTTETFATIAELMAALRSSKSTPESDETLRREAYMRQQIRQAQKDGYQQIVVVCGAWHVPALSIEKPFTASTDAAILKSGKKAKVEATWIPWSFERLTIQRGYMAGVRAPVWYQYLHEHGTQQAMNYWMSDAARLFRAQDLPISSAHAIEAIRLADTLAQIRGTAIPGIDEMTESAISVMCGGNATSFQPIKHQLVIGDVIGHVPAGLNKSPLKSDFEARVSAARMKVQSVSTPLALDLREAAHLKKSILLHQLTVLDVPWGAIQDSNAQNRKGSWHEDWLLEWQPEFELRLIELAAFGSTILQAAEHKAAQQAQASTDLKEIVGLLSRVMKSELPSVIPILLTKLKQLSIGTSDTFTLAETALPLAEIQRYGSARTFQTDVIQAVLEDILTRVQVQLPSACIGLDEEQDAAAAKTMLKLNRAIHFPEQAAQKPSWAQTLTSIADQAVASPMCTGLAYRLLFDQGHMMVEAVSSALSRMVSKGQEPYQAALWLEGFLQGNALLIIHHEPFFEVLDAWIKLINEDDFEQIIPVLRRAFSMFSEPERHQIMRIALAKETPPAPVATPTRHWSTEDTEQMREENAWLF
jgi:Family of unknown function (DUF5682)